MDYIMNTVTFNWTNLRHLGLVGGDGEDLDVEGVTHEGNLVHVDRGLLREVPAPDRGDARDVNGTGWVVAVPA